MNRLHKNHIINSKSFLVMIFTIATVLGVGRDAQAGGGAFVGGMLAGHLVTGAVNRSERRTEAEEYSAYSQPAQQTQQPQQTSTKTTEQKLGELDTLAAKGYITKSEYQSRKKAILDQM